MRAMERGRSQEAVNDGLAHSRQARLWWRAGDSFFPPRLSEPSCLQEGIGDHCHERVAMQPGPRAALEMIEAEFFLELLMRLFADPAGLDGAGDVFDRGVGGKIGEIVFPLAVGAMLAHQPGLFARHMLCASSADPLWRWACSTCSNQAILPASCSLELRFLSLS